MVLLSHSKFSTAFLQLVCLCNDFHASAPTLSKVFIVTWMKNVPHSPMYLTTCYPGVGLFQGCCETFKRFCLDEVGHWGRLWGLVALTYFPFTLFDFCMWLKCDQPSSSSYQTLLCLPHHYGPSVWYHKQNRVFLQWAIFVMVFYRDKRKETNKICFETEVIIAMSTQLLHSALLQN